MKPQSLQTPLGEMIACSTDGKLLFLEFADQPDIDLQLQSLFSREIFSEALDDLLIIEQTEQELNEYFSGKRSTFSILLETGGTPFQQSVWSILQKIPYGETRSYSSIARELGDLKSIRAVAGANGKNHIAILIPCHRVIGADGSLTGYAGGLWRKKKLLELEGAQAPVPEGQERLF